MYCAKLYKVIKMWKKIGLMGIIALLLVAALVPMVSAKGEATNMWDKISVKQGTTNALGGGSYISIGTNNTRVNVIYGNNEHKNVVRIVVDTIRYAGGLKIYNKDGTLKDKKILRYHAFVGQAFNYIAEVRNINNNRSVVKFVALNNSWNMDGLKITNISSNETRIDFTLYMNNVPYTEVFDNASLGDGVVNKIALHFHITVQMENKTIRGFPWYSYRPGKGLSLDGRKNYTGEMVSFQIKYDKEIDGWDYNDNTSKIIVANNIFWGISGNDKLIHMIAKRYGGSRADVGNRSYGNNTLPHRRMLFRHSGRIVFTEVGDWQRIGKFRWESNVTVDNQTRQAYYQIVGGERIVRWYDHGVFALTVLKGALIYPVGSSIFQDPSIEVNEFYISFGNLVVPSMGLSIIGIAAVAIVLVAFAIYRIKK